VLDLSIEALAIGTSAPKNDIATKRHKKHKMKELISLPVLRLLCLFVAIY
jgi:hypothetical protein